MTTQATPQSTPRTTPAQQLEAARSRHASLQQRRADAMAKLSARRALLEEAQREAKALFGTDSLDELRALHSRLTHENQTAVSTFLEELDRAETSLKELETLLGR